MKRVILAVISIGFLAVSCGGGNVSKVKNGVFSNYDKTITVGKALENNKILKGGKWKEVKMNGRDYVTYTVIYTGAQLMELLESLSDYKNNPNYTMVNKFNYNLYLWKASSKFPETFAEITSMSVEEVNQARDIFNEIYIEEGKNDIEPALTVDRYEIILSFIINQDKTFNINMLESYTEVTLKCFNNLKVQFKGGNSDNDQYILTNIYREFNPIIF